MGLCENMFIRSKAMSRLTVRKYSVLDHHRLDNALQHHFDTHNVEDAEINFFVVATSLTDNDVRILDRCQIWQTVRASTSISELFPPFVTEDGKVLIDGGLLDNVPVNVMRDLMPGSNLILNFLSPKPRRVKTKYIDLPTRWQALTALVKPFCKGAELQPTIFSTLSRSMVVNARKLLKQTEIGPDVLLNLYFARHELYGLGARQRAI